MSIKSIDIKENNFDRAEKKFSDANPPDAFKNTIRHAPGNLALCEYPLRTRCAEPVTQQSSSAWIKKSS